MSIIAIGLPYLAKLETDQLVQKNGELFQFIYGTPYGIFLIILLIIFLVEILERIINSIFDYFTGVEKLLFDRYIESEIYKKFLLISPGYFLSKRNNRLVTELQSAGTNIPREIKSFFSSIFGQIVIFGSIITILGSIDWRIIPGIIFSIFIGAKISKIQEAYTLRHNLNAGYQMEYEVREVMRILNTEHIQIRMNGAQDSILARAESGLMKTVEYQRKKMGHDIVYGILHQLNSGISGVLVKAIVGYSIFLGFGSVGVMMMTIMYVNRIESFFRFLVQIIPDIRNFSDSVKKFEIFLAITSQGEILNQKKFDETLEKISLKDFTFQYPKLVQEEMEFINITINRLKQYESKLKDYELDELHLLENLKKEAEYPSPIILKDITMEFQIGKMYGLVGKNGAGKTTLIYQMLGFFPEYKGSLKYNSTEIRSIQGTSLGKMISIISQDPFILDGIFTIRDNLLFGVVDTPSDDIIWNLLDDFGLAEKIRSLRLGLETPMGWDIDLSGGQRQLLVIIRVILQDRQVLILDEGTSQLDAENELRVMKRLLERKMNKIIIFITHRLSTIQKADVILCLENGGINDRGAHSELLQKESLYKKLYEMQIGNKSKDEER